jgi:hypothetical protein
MVTFIIHSQQLLFFIFLGCTKYKTFVRVNIYRTFFSLEKPIRKDRVFFFLLCLITTIIITIIKYIKLFSTKLTKC